jgi:hypothetical protein
MKKSLLLLSFILLVFLSKNALGQEVIDTPITNFYKPPRVYVNFPVKGRVIGIVNLEELEGVAIANKRTSEKTTTNSHGFYQLNAAKGDTLLFNFSRYSKDVRVIKSPKENLNVILINKKVNSLPANSSKSDLKKAEREDEDLYRILEKDAEREGKWNY